MIGLIYFLVSLGVIVLVHELGHLVVAKRNGVYCHEFSIGMGPRIKKLGVDKTGTEYSIRAIPLGGYVMMAGEDDGKSADENIDPSQMLSNKSAWVKIKVLFAGSMMNMVLAIFLMMIVGFFAGVPSNSTQITVAPESPLYAAGVQTGDQITSVDGKPVTSFDEITNTLKDSGDTANITYTNSSGTSNEVSVERASNGKFGVASYTVKYKFFGAIKYGFVGTFNLIMMIITTLQMLFTPQYGAKDLAGFVGIYSMGNAVIQNGLMAGIGWIAYLSVNIGFINLLPIPALDGGRLVFAFYELIFRRRANAKLENIVNTVGVLLLLLLFVYVTYNDILRLFK